MPVAVAEILVPVPTIRLGRVVVTAAFRWRVGGENRRAMLEIQCDVALKMNRKTPVRAGRKLHRAATSRVRGINGFVDRGGINRLAVTHRAKSFDIEDSRAKRVAINFPPGGSQGRLPMCIS